MVVLVVEFLKCVREDYSYWKYWPHLASDRTMPVELTAPQILPIIFFPLTWVIRPCDLRVDDGFQLDNPCTLKAQAHDDGKLHITVLPSHLSLNPHPVTTLLHFLPASIMPSDFSAGLYNISTPITDSSLTFFVNSTSGGKLPFLDLWLSKFWLIYSCSKILQFRE